MLWFCRQRFHNGLLEADCCGGGSSSMIPPGGALCQQLLLCVLRQGNEMWMSACTLLACYKGRQQPPE